MSDQLMSEHLWDSPYLAPLVRTTVTEQIATRLVDFILGARLKPGNKLPSERELMVRLSVGRSSLREAIKTLTALGVVQVSVGEGMFVGRGDLSLLTKPLSWALLMGERSTHELVEARRVIEVELAGLAADRATEEDVLAIGQCLEVMRESLDSADRYSQADLAFHLLVARAARNRVLFHVLETLQHIIRAWMVKVLAALDGKPVSLDEHVPIYAAIRAHDPQAARKAMAAHMELSGVKLLAVIAAVRVEGQEPESLLRDGCADAFVGAFQGANTDKGGVA